MIPFFWLLKQWKWLNFNLIPSFTLAFFQHCLPFRPFVEFFRLVLRFFNAYAQQNRSLILFYFYIALVKKSDLRRWNKLVFVNNRTTEQQREKNKQFCPFDMPQLHQHHHHHHTNIIRTIAGEYLKVQIYLWLSVCVYVYSSTSMGCSIYA